MARGNARSWRWRLGRSPWLGIVLGVLLTIAWGWWHPLAAQTHAWQRQQVIAQLLPDPAPPRPVPFENPRPSGGNGGSEELPSIVPPPPVIPVDITDHWAADCIRELAQRRWLPVDDQAQFSPETPATWTVAQSLLNQALPTEGGYGGASPLETALQLPSSVNVLYSYPRQYYDPAKPLSRTDAIAAIAAKLSLPYVARANALVQASLSDGQDVPAYGRDAVASALVAGKLVNYPTAQTLNGNRPITRGELAALICQAVPDPSLQRTLDPTWIAQPQPLPAQPQPNPELRGVWLTNIDSDVLFSQENLAEAVRRLKAMNINTLYPVVWNSGYTQYPSRVAERWLGKKQRLWPGENPAFEAAQGDRDPLQELIDLAHAEGMAVIPWFEFGFMAPADYAVLRQHPDWFTQRLDGTREIVMGEEVFVWMNPLHPDTRRLLLLLMAEVLENYDVEGIQVDDHLGLPVDMGYDPYTVALYQREHAGQSPPEDETDPDWMRWRADKISAFMQDVRTLINQRQPGALLSVSPNPYPFSYAKYLQDWPAWERAGILDEIVVQIYREDLDRFVWELNKPALIAARQATPTSVGLLSGLRGRPTGIDLLTQQLEAVRDRRYAGVSYFYYQSLWVPGRETQEERNAQFQAAFAQPSDRPRPE